MLGELLVVGAGDRGDQKQKSDRGGKQSQVSDETFQDESAGT
jgi:hypothetical protein